VARRRLLLLALGALLLAGCASTQRRGERALSAGQYNDAIHLFQAVLAEEPDRLDARLGLGIALYKVGAWPDAALTLDEVLARAPSERPALLYRGLVAIQRGEDAVAEDRLTRFRDSTRLPRFAAQLGRALRVLHGSGDVSADTREFIATSLEDVVGSAREIEEARLAVQRAYLMAYPPIYCVPTRRGWICL
jgi:tetratricopeptide (TPR) repeat protein